MSTGQTVFLVGSGVGGGGAIGGEVFGGVGDGGGQGVLFVVGEGGADDLFYLAGVEVDARAEFHDGLVELRLWGKRGEGLSSCVERQRWMEGKIDDAHALLA